MYNMITDIKYENDGKAEKLIFVKQNNNRLMVSETDLGENPEVWTHEKKEKTHKDKSQIELIFHDVELAPELLTKFNYFKPMNIDSKNVETITLGCMGDDSLMPIYIVLHKNNCQKNCVEDDTNLIVMLS